MVESSIKKVTALVSLDQLNELVKDRKLIGTLPCQGFIKDPKGGQKRVRCKKRANVYDDDPRAWGGWYRLECSCGFWCDAGPPISAHKGWRASKKGGQ